MNIECFNSYGDRVIRSMHYQSLVWVRIESGMSMVAYLLIELDPNLLTLAVSGQLLKDREYLILHKPCKYKFNSSKFLLYLN